MLELQRRGKWRRGGRQRWWPWRPRWEWRGALRCERGRASRGEPGAISILHVRCNSDAVMGRERGDGEGDVWAWGGWETRRAIPLASFGSCVAPPALLVLRIMWLRSFDVGHSWPKAVLGETLGNYPSRMEILVAPGYILENHESRLYTVQCKV